MAAMSWQRQNRLLKSQSARERVSTPVSICKSLQLACRAISNSEGPSVLPKSPKTPSLAEDSPDELAGEDRQERVTAERAGDAEADTAASFTAINA